MIDPGDVIVLMGMQRSGTHMLGAAIGSHSQMKYTGEIFSRVYPKNFAEVIRGVDRCRSPGMILCVDVKYNQFTPPLVQLAQQCRGVVHIVRTDLMASYFSGEFHTWRGLNPVAYQAGRVPTFTFNKAKFKEIMAERKKWIAQREHLETLRLCYEELTGGREIDLLPEWAGRQICELARVPYEPLVVGTLKDAPDYKDHLRF